MTPKKKPPVTGPALFLNEGVRHRILKGHPWVFQSEVDRVENDPTDGEPISLYGPKGQFLGNAIYNSRSQIIARRYSRAPEPLAADLISNRLRKALAYRAVLPPCAAQRLVWSESDGLPGLIVDRYADILVLQTLTLAMALREDEIAAWFIRELKPRAILARNDAPIRKLEGLPLERKILSGDYTPPTRLAVSGIDFDLDLWEGHKTGFYLDQSENYERVAAYAKGKRMLDCFTNQGGFALTALRAGAVSCLALDQDETALAQASATAQRHGLKAEWIAGNVFDLLRLYERERRQFDLIVLDPPSFTKTKSRVDAAVRGYKEIHLRALRLLPVGGLLATFCCSHHVDEVEWRQMIESAAAETNSSLRLRERLTQSRDHPILTSVPETEYLRGCILEKIDV